MCYTCKKENLQGSDWQTGHFFRKRILPMQLKYDLRILRPQCAYCNLRQKGHEAVYACELLIRHGENYLLDFYDEYKTLKEEKLTVKQQRVFLEKTIERYKSM